MLGFNTLFDVCFLLIIQIFCLDNALLFDDFSSQNNSTMEKGVWYVVLDFRSECLLVFNFE